jgi:hypothetical protein
MVDIHYFIFIINGDTAIFALAVFLMSYIALRLVYRMWRRSLRCPHCGETYKPAPAPQQMAEKTLPTTLWT